MAQNDKGTINISDLEEELELLLQLNQLPNCTIPALYDVDIYADSTDIVNGNQNDGYFHARMNVCRTAVEHEFGLTASLFKW